MANSISELMKNSIITTKIGQSLLDYGLQAGTSVISNFGAAGVNIALVVLGEELIKRSGNSQKIRSLSRYLGADVTQYNKLKVLEKLIDDKNQFDKLNNAVLLMCNTRDFSGIKNYFNKEFGLTSSESLDVYLAIKDIIMDYQTLGSIIEICKKLISIDSKVSKRFKDLDNDISLQFRDFHDNISKLLFQIQNEISDLNKSMKERIFALGMSSSSFELIQESDLTIRGRNDCWLTGIFTKREINIHFDARRLVLNEVICSIENNFGTIVFGKGSTGKSKLALRIINELILYENYVVLFTDDVSEEIIPNLKPFIDNLLEKYPKILIVIDDAHKIGIEKIMYLYNQLYDLQKTELYSQLRFLFLAKHREFEALKDTVSNGRLQGEFKIAIHNLKKVSIPEFNLEEATIFINKSLEVTYPNVKFDYVEIVSKFLFNKSRENLQVFLCNLRQVLGTLRSRQSQLTQTLPYILVNLDKTEFTECMNEQIKKKLPLLKTSLTEQELDSFFKILFLRLFGIKLNDFYLDKLHIFRHHLAKLSEIELISLDTNEYLHEDFATEMIISIFNKFDNHLESLEYEYHIKNKLHFILQNLQSNDFLNVFNKCQILYDDKDKENRTFQLGHMVMNMFDDPSNLIKDKDKVDLYRLYTHGLGNFYHHIGDFNKSVKMHDIAIEIDRNLPDAYDGKGISLSRLGRDEEAIKVYDKALKLDPKHVNAHYNKAISLYNLNLYTKAIPEFNKAIKYNPTDSDAHFFKAACLLQLEKYSFAIRELNKAIEKNSYYINAFVSKGEVLASLGDYFDALEQFDIALEIDPNHARSHYGKALSLSNLDRFEESLLEYDLAIANGMENADVYHEKGLSLLYLEEFEHAIKVYDKALEIDPNHARSHYSKGTSLVAIEKDIDAINEFRLAIENDPNYLRAFDSLGISYSHLGMDEEAIATYDQALAINPEDSTVHYHKALSLFFLGKLKDSLLEYDLAIKYESDFVLAYFNKAVSLMDLQLYEESIKVLDKVIELDPSFLPAKDQKGWIIANYIPQRLNESIASLRDTISECPDSSFLLYTYAYSLDKINDYPGAIDSYRKVILMDPDFADAYYDCAKSLNKQNTDNSDLCLEYLRKAIALDKDYKEKARVDTEFISLRENADFVLLVTK
jgi:tetratricopeptide (TPR) repeat protein